MSMNDHEAERIADETADTPSTSAKENNENDIHLKSDPAAFRSDDTVMSAELRSESSDRIYPDEI
ncbi:hypothetical protein [Cohnella caldifontis]|uniref:hypothetical protein n=1 Tax=Cohnella caldifontis TaxID=3027471 RepID=UPI0023ED2B14|nr:hypothetical protein [Cohnella sp. YIM B05605]